MENFILSRKANGFAPRTLKEYTWHIRKFFATIPEAWTGGTASMKTAVLRYMSPTPPLGPVAHNHRKKFLGCFFSWCVQEGALAENPMGAVKYRRETPRIGRGSIDDVLKVLSSLGACDAFTSARDRALILFQLDTGIRPKEALSLLPGDIGEDFDLARIRPEEAKTREPRTVFVSETTSSALRGLMAQRPEGWGCTVPVFCSWKGEPMSSHAWGHRFKKLGAAVGVTVSPYDLRHLFALSYLRNGGNLLSLRATMGHHTLSTTERYVALALDDLKDAHAAASPVSRAMGANAATQKATRKGGARHG